MGDIFLLSLSAAVYPTLLAAVTIMLMLPRPTRLLLGFLLGAYTMGIAIGLAIVFAVEGSDAVDATRQTYSPALDLAVGCVALLVAFVLGTGRDERLTERRRRRRKTRKQGDPRWRRVLGRGSARVAFAVGAALSLPSISYLIALGNINRGDYGTAETVALVIGFNLVMLAFLEIPLLGYLLAPEWTRDTVQRFRDWLARNGRQIALIAAIAIGVAAITRGTVGLLT